MQRGGWPRAGSPGKVFRVVRDRIGLPGKGVSDILGYLETGGRGRPEVHVLSDAEERRCERNPDIFITLEIESSNSSSHGGHVSQQGHGGAGRRWVSRRGAAAKRVGGRGMGSVWVTGGMAGEMDHKHPFRRPKPSVRRCSRVPRAPPTKSNDIAMHPGALAFPAYTCWWGRGQPTAPPTPTTDAIRGINAAHTHARVVSCRRTQPVGDIGAGGDGPRIVKPPVWVWP